MVAVSWLVYRLTDDSIFYLGLVAFCNHIPVFLGSPITGVLADKWPRRRIIMFTQIFSMIQAFILAVLVASDNITVFLIVLLSLFRGVINAFDIPSRQAFVYEMVDNDEDLPNAIALNSLILNMARLAGPSIAGFIIALAGEATCFFVNAISFVTIIFALAAMKQTRSAGPRHEGAVLDGLKDGLDYAFGFVPIRAVLVYAAVMSLVAFPYMVLMPAFAKNILQGGPKTLGFLLGAIGAGALIGAIFLARRKSVQGLEKVMVIAGCIFTAGIIGFSFSRNPWLSIFLMVLPGFGVMVQIASINIILQMIVDDDKRGRVLSLLVMAFLGTMPFGSLLIGFIAEYLGAPHTLLLSSLLGIVVIISFAKKLPHIQRMIHPIYVRKGIIPEVAQGLQAASDIVTQTKD